MMAPRTIISGSIFTQSKPTIDQTLHELQTELHQARNKIRDLEYELSIARANVARLKKRNGEVIPHGDIDDGYECPNCAFSVTEDMSYCPGCGAHIDWRVYASTGGDDSAYDRKFDR